MSISKTLAKILIIGGTAGATGQLLRSLVDKNPSVMKDIGDFTAVSVGVAAVVGVAGGIADVGFDLLFGQIWHNE